VIDDCLCCANQGHVAWNGVTVEFVPIVLCDDFRCWREGGQPAPIKDGDVRSYRERGLCYLCAKPLAAWFTTGVVPEWWKNAACPDCLPRWAWPKSALDALPAKEA
jgi:hypothetical protein